MKKIGKIPSLKMLLNTIILIILIPLKDNHTFL